MWYVRAEIIRWTPWKRAVYAWQYGAANYPAALQLTDGRHHLALGSTVGVVAWFLGFRWLSNRLPNLWANHVDRDCPCTWCVRGRGD